MNLKRFIHIIDVFSEYGKTSVHPKDKTGRVYHIEFDSYEDNDITFTIETHDNYKTFSASTSQIEQHLKEYEFLKEVEIDINSIKDEEKKMLIKMVTT